MTNSYEEVKLRMIDKTLLPQKPTGEHSHIITASNQPERVLQINASQVAYAANGTIMLVDTDDEDERPDTIDTSLHIRHLQLGSDSGSVECMSCNSFMMSTANCVHLLYFALDVATGSGNFGKVC